jgi:hypothetical protein
MINRKGTAVRRGHDTAPDHPPATRLAEAFSDLARAI